MQRWWKWTQRRAEREERNEAAMQHAATNLPLPQKPETTENRSRSDGRVEFSDAIRLMANIGVDATGFNQAVQQLGRAIGVTSQQMIGAILAAQKREVERVRADREFRTFTEVGVDRTMVVASIQSRYPWWNPPSLSGESARMVIIDDPIGNAGTPHQPIVGQTVRSVVLIE